MGYFIYLMNYIMRIVNYKLMPDSPVAQAMGEEQGGEPEQHLQ
jgi:hypothetical protein